MSLRKVNSRLFSAMGYDPLRKLLEVKFKMSGRIYAFLDVQAELYEKFSGSKSKAHFFNKFIKDHYKSFLLS